MARYAAFLRGISNVSMAPFRDAMAELGFDNVATHGMSGNLVFDAPAGGLGDLERRIGERFGTPAVVRAKADLSKILERAPLGARGAILLLAKRPSASRQEALANVDFEEPRPVLAGRTVYFVHPARVVGRRSPFDFEQLLGVPGTARSFGVVTNVAAMM